MDQKKIVIGMGIAIVIGLFLMINTTASGAGKTIQATPSKDSLSLPPMVDGKQDIFLKATEYGTYSPSNLKVKKGIPVRIHFSADAGAACGHEIIFPEYNVRKLAPAQGEILIEFTPPKIGKFPFHCSMKMFNGTIEVVE